MTNPPAAAIMRAMVLRCEEIHKSFGGLTVLRGASLYLKPGARLGLVGVNGSGKTTLLHIIAGIAEADAGIIQIARGTRVGLLSQVALPDAAHSVFEELRGVFEPVFAMERRLREMEEAMAGDSSPRLLAEYDALTHRFEEADGYAWKSSILGVLAGLGFPPAQHGQSVATLSGGEKTRLALAKLLLQKPDLLLLDEPTNHLDLSSADWLEDTLRRYPGAILTVSHDRTFLDAVCDGIAELLFGEIEQYEGGYSRYLLLRQERVESRMRVFSAQQEEIERLKAVILRYRSFHPQSVKSFRAAKSREKRLSKLADASIDRPREERAIHFSFHAARPTGNDVMTLTNLSKSYGDRVLFRDFSAKIYAGDRVAIIGPNGAGKTTLLRALLGSEPPGRGSVRLGAGVETGYYDQKQTGLTESRTVLREVWDDFPRMTQTEVRSILGAFLFQGDDVFQTISTLSGGERARICLIKLMMRGHNLLILDEPTNHLDMDSRGVLEEALNGFEGTIIAVSHDRWFINRIATRVFAFEDIGGDAPNIALYEGNYDDMLAEKRRLATPEAALALNRTAARAERKQERAEAADRKQARETLLRMEADIEAAEEELARLEAELARPGLWDDPAAGRGLVEAYDTQRTRLDALYAAWHEALEG